ncbi:MAG: hypothetical protein IVW52_17935 [Acidimicrobiales bacterium]|nr:hypothetical protein [Acidimicrobiales bacterium]
MDSATSKSRPVARLAARLAGRVPAATVEAYLRAGSAVYDDFFAAEALRRDLVASGTDLWSLGAGPSSQLLATWCAFGLQTLGERLVASENAASPRMAGYLPAMTAEQASVFLDAGRTWSARARRAVADAGYDLADEVRLPATLPVWKRMEPCPPTHVEAMLAAAQALSDRGQAALADFCGSSIPAEHTGTADQLRGLYAQADAAIGQAEQMWRPSRYQPLHRAVEDALRDALDQLFRLGQVLARPSLLGADGAKGAGRGRHRMPGEPGFDPWCLSDSAAARSLGGDLAAKRALEHLWGSDPDPAATLALLETVEQEADDGSITGSDESGSYYYCTPWPTIYTVRRPVTIAGHNLTPGEQFTLDICVGGHMGRAPGFHRDLLVQNFHPTSRLRYCDQESDRPVASW